MEARSKVETKRATRRDCFKDGLGTKASVISTHLRNLLKVESFRMMI